MQNLPVLFLSAINDVYILVVTKETLQFPIGKTVHTMRLWWVVVMLNVARFEVLTAVVGAEGTVVRQHTGNYSTKDSITSQKN